MFRSPHPIAHTRPLHLPRRSRLRTGFAAARVGLAALAASVGMVVAPAASLAATGEIRYGASCNAQDRAFLDASIRAGRIAAMSDAFAECLGQEMHGYVPCPGYDPGAVANAGHADRVQRVLDLARGPNDLQVECAGGHGGHASSTFIGYQHTQPEPVHWDRQQLDQFRDSAMYFGSARGCSSLNDLICTPPSGSHHLVAATVWHELIHTHDFAHWQSGGPQCNGPANLERQMPQIVARCLQEVIYRSGFACGFSEPSCGPDAQGIVDGRESTTCECVADVCLDGVEPIDTNGDDIGDACTWDARVEANPSSLAFRYSRTSVWTGARDVVVASVGTDPVTFGNASFAGIDRNSFSIVTDDCSQATLVAGDTCRISIRFRASPLPRIALRHAAQLILTSNASNQPKLSIALSGDPFTNQIQVERKPRPSYRFNFEPFSMR